MMTDSVFVKKLIDCAKNYKTLYVMGCFGAPMGYGTNRQRYTNNNDYNKKPVRKQMILNASDDTFGFDCVCLVKGILWGWDGNLNKVYGGASYASNGVPDVGTEQMIAMCDGVTSDFKNIVAGELVWMSGHVGVYIGDGLVVECTPAWENKVQITCCANVGKKTGYYSRVWTKHGKLPWIKYEGVTPTPTPTPKPVDDNPYKVLPLLRYGSTGDLVTLLQIQLKIDADGIFGTQTENAVKAYQTLKKLEVDGIVGKNTYKALFG